MPAFFIGHGSPMAALEDNDVTRAWAAIGALAPRPRAILAISAHWLTIGTAATAMTTPRTVHDFGAFPKALFEVQYPAPGDPTLAARVRDLLAPASVRLDMTWGLDHGTWSVLVHAFPKADVPVIQLSLDVSKSATDHYSVGRALAPLRDEGVLILGTGNIVHNLGIMDRSNSARIYDGCQRFADHIRTAIRDDDPQAVIDYMHLGEDARLSVPTPDHFWPLLPVLGTRAKDDRVSLATDFIRNGSMSMTSVLIGT